MTEQPDIPFEAYFRNGQPTNEQTWTPPPPEPEPDQYDRLIEGIRALKALSSPPPEPSTDPDYTDYFPFPEGAA